MKTPIKPWLVILFTVWLLPVAARAGGEWEKRGTLSVHHPGLVETRLLPGLHAQMDPDRFDLTLTGPDGRPRAFELFMGSLPDVKTVELTPKTVRLTGSGSFVWEADGPDVIVSTLSVTASEPRFVASIKAEGFIGGVWRVLAKNEALYQTGSVTRAEFRIPSGQYTTLRLTFAGFDQKNNPKILPISRVTAASAGKDEALELMTVPLSFTRKEKTLADESVVEVKARLDGSGLLIRNLALRSEAPFLGHFEIGREEIREGRLVFVSVEEGIQTRLKPGRPSLSLDLNRRWPGHSLVIRLYPRETFIGKITALDLEIQAPRLLFSADRPGDYHLATGLESPQNLSEFSQSGDEGEKTRVDISNLETHEARQVRRLVEKYPLKGGPFDEQGYAWSAAVPIAEPGYYRLALHFRAGLDNNRNGMRIVREGLQIPFLFSSEYEKSIPLSLTPSYDEKANRTSWELSLPMASKHWESLKLRASGMFTRNVEFLVKKAGYNGWKPLRTLSWTNETPAEASLTIPLDSWAAESGTFLIRIAHGDNQPMILSSVEAYYSTFDLLFLARDPGDYLVYGGHQEAAAPVYDLTLVRNDLLAAVPVDIAMPDPAPLSSSPINTTLTGLFHGKSWGLYIVLGLVTLVLMGLVAKLFPKSTFGPH
jgi:hypothetical protein